MQSKINSGHIIICNIGENNTTQQNCFYQKNRKKNSLKMIPTLCTSGRGESVEIDSQFQHMQQTCFTTVSVLYIEI